MPPADRPPVNVVRVAFQTMVGIGTLLALLGVVYSSTWLRRGRLPPSPLVLPRGRRSPGPLSVVALIAGWVTTEVGRQPWVVYGVMRTRGGGHRAPTASRSATRRWSSSTSALVAAPSRGCCAGSRACRSSRRERRASDVAALRSRCVFVLVGLVAYAVLAGADFGAGFWQLLAGRAGAGARVREHAHHAMGPVWEANHVWLIFVLVVCWTAYPVAFGSIASTLAVPLFIAAVGIILRGDRVRAAIGDARRPASERPIERLFAISSMLTPFALGAVVGGDRLGPRAGRQRRGRPRRRAG